MAKEKVICDTDVLIDYFDANQKRHLQTKPILEQNIGISNILISSITKMELISGATNKADLNTIIKKLNRFSILLINEAINLRAIDLVQSYRLSHGLALADAMIAATAIQTDLELFTYNVKDFKFVSKLTLYERI
jgi:predicted nucleic acid-binding protein